MFLSIQPAAAEDLCFGSVLDRLDAISQYRNIMFFCLFVFLVFAQPDVNHSLFPF